MCSVEAGYPECVSLAIHFARQFEIVVAQLHTTRGALQTLGMMFLTSFSCNVGRLHVLALDAFAARSTQ